MTDVQTCEVEISQTGTTTFDALSIPCRWIDEASVGTHRVFVRGQYHHECDGCGSVLDLTVPFEVTIKIEAAPKKRRRWFGGG